MNMLINFRKIYFAIISTVSMIVVGVTAVDLLSFAITTVFPDLIAPDMARLDELLSEEEGANAFLRREVRPLNSEIISDVIRMIILGLLLFWHLPRLLSDDDTAQ
jgi:hypothetical protein